MFHIVKNLQTETQFPIGTHAWGQCYKPPRRNASWGNLLCMQKKMCQLRYSFQWPFFRKLKIMLTKAFVNWGTSVIMQVTQCPTPSELGIHFTSERWKPECSWLPESVGIELWSWAEAWLQSCRSTTVPWGSLASYIHRWAEWIQKTSV